LKSQEYSIPHDVSLSRSRLALTNTSIWVENYSPANWSQRQSQFPKLRILKTYDDRQCPKNNNV
jgi:hypothetical protein